MGARIPLPIPIGFYEHQSSPMSSQDCINWIPSIPEAAALNNACLLQPDGITQFAVTTFGPSRGSQTMGNVPFFVAGNRLISIGPTGLVNDIGEITGAGRVDMANNGTILVIVVPGADAFVYDSITMTLEQITDSDYQVSDTVLFYRGFFTFTTSDGKQIFVSNLNAPLTFDALDFGSAEGDPDRIITQILDHDELSIIGESTTEKFKLVGGAGFPYQIIPGAYTEKGSSAKFGVIKFDNTYIFVGGSVSNNERPAIWRQTSSSSASKLSTDAVDFEIQKFTDEEISNAYAMTQSQKGQFIVYFTFESNRIPNLTFAYNATASALSGQQVWFKVQSGVKSDSWRVNTITKAYGKILCGDAKDGRIGFLDDGNFTEYGDVIFRQCVLKPFANNGQEIFAGELEVAFEAGVGLTTGQGSDPVVMMDYSDDGGRTFKFETKRKIGKIGEYGHQSVWRRQKSFPVARSIRLTVTDPVKANLNRLAATPELGTQ